MTAFLLCAGMAVIPLVALRSAGSAGAARVAASSRRRGPVSPAVVVSLAPTTVLDVEAAAAVRPAPADFSTPLAVAAAAPAASVAPVLARQSSTPPVPAPGPQPAVTPVPVPPVQPVVSTTAAPRPVVTTAPKPPAVVAHPVATAPTKGEQGLASWYYAPPGSCAHPTLPFGTVLTVTDVANGRSVTCRVDDRGPYAGGRVVDLSPDVFARLAPLGTGVAVVRVTW